jgi:hypothetical protein
MQDTASAATPDSAQGYTLGSIEDTLVRKDEWR